ncbi:MAG: phosphoglucosamine mutase [Clostridia bacterium]|nr:phosphoglucosamine mutase [Clostridia bacterium]
MGSYFGTDGIRGITNEFLTGDLAFKAGNALGQIKNKALIVVGRDTRVSGDMLALSLASGAISAGATVYDLGIIPTAGIAYVTKELKADFGVVISASHNPPEYNGIKVFSSEGYKLDRDLEDEIEKKMASLSLLPNDEIGRYFQKPELVDSYGLSIENICKEGLKGLKVIIDCSNGASYKVAPKIFEDLGADVVAINVSNAGVDINKDCGALHPEKLAKMVVETNSHCGFAYDGDSDRLIAVDEKGNIIDGDKLIYMLANYYKEKGILQNNLVVGTTHTNMGVQKKLLENGIEMHRSDIGDKYVIEMMLKDGAVVGGEQSGHIILKNYTTTGDGILSSIAIAKILAETKRPLSSFIDVQLYPQANFNVKVKDKVRVLNNEQLAKAIEKEKEYLKNRGRVVVRASGTEDIIRIFTETESEELSKEVTDRLVKVIENI